MHVSNASMLVRKHVPFFKVDSKVHFQNVGCLAFGGSIPKNS